MLYLTIYLDGETSECGYKYTITKNFSGWTACRNDNEGRVSEGVIFDDWMQGLPSIFGADYYLHCTALDDLGVILEETEAEKARFTEDDAAKLLSSLIFREIKRQ